jgi:hypothetical protein
MPRLAIAAGLVSDRTVKGWLVLVVVLASCWRNERLTATPPPAPSPDAAV